jgi:hypothetical protein
MNMSFYFTSFSGFDIILSSFIQHYTTSPSGQNARLLLKGLDDMYNSRDMFQKEIIKIGSIALRLVKSGIIKYLGTRMKQSNLIHLICSSDVYLTPYRAEGFNMPALEAAACGLTIITTSLRSSTTYSETTINVKGETSHSDYTDDSSNIKSSLYNGLAPTDSWCLPAFCKFINSKIVAIHFLNDQPGYMMSPDIHHLRQIMRMTTTTLWKKKKLLRNEKDLTNEQNNKQLTHNGERAAIASDTTSTTPSDTTSTTSIVQNEKRDSSFVGGNDINNRMTRTSGNVIERNHLQSFHTWHHVGLSFLKMLSNFTL